MLFTFLILQFALPISLITWIAAKPQTNLLGFWSQIFAICSALIMAALIGIWILPPWWMPYVYFTLLIIIVYFAVKNRPFRNLLPQSTTDWVVFMIFILTFGFSAHNIFDTIKGWKLLEIESVDLSFPLEKGNYIVANGGNHRIINSHLKIMDNTDEKKKLWRGNAYGVDLVAINKYGFRSSGIQPADPREYNIFGKKVLAPCDGEIIATCNTLPDLWVPKIDKDNKAGNYILLRGSKADILLAHLRQGSLKVNNGDRVKAGQILGEVGNSGQSNEPHLHIHAQRPGTSDAQFSGDPIQLKLDGKFLVRNDLCYL